ncbi:glycosyltransferase family 2 protein [Acidovorax cavernicola]|uniref:Glycosyltransferase family 2 protein n=1 Tax=Acidovorax cavernicola TaxID=1675792 RepID=A0A9X8GTK0_9BURK|nr:glycosyltransferase family 2 protein [Acidovorax cavernicola]RIX75730.1 glycosyltransferase family 2 protein [Acidovorax cavernicola]
MTLPRLHFTSLSEDAVCGDIVQTYRLAAERLGYPTAYAPATVDPDAVNLLFFFWNIPWKNFASLHPNCIVVNLEPMVEGTHAWNANYLDLLPRCYLWEYSKTNFQRHRELGYQNADCVPLGWEPDAARILPWSEVLPEEARDIDVCFFGSLTQRRIDIIDALRSRGLRVEVTSSGFWSLEKREATMRRTKVMLNLHNWEDSRVVETPRLSTLLRHRKAVVCELYPDSEVDPAFRDAVVGVPYDQLVDAVVALVADAPRRVQLEREGLDKINATVAPPDIGPALGRYFAWRAQQPDRVPPVVMPRVTVCLTLDGTRDDWLQDLRDWTTQADVALELVVAAAGLPATAEDEARAIAPNLRWIALPMACDRATLRNLALAQATEDHVVFAVAGDRALPGRVQRQAALLAACPDLDIVGCWSETPTGPLKYAQRHDEIVAEALSSEPLQLSACLIRRRFLERTGVRHDPEFSVHDDLQMLCRCIVAGARFAVIPQVLHRPAPVEPPADLPHAASLAMRARRAVLRHLLPRSRVADIDLIAQLYAHLWPPQRDFAEQLLRTVAHACIAPTGTRRIDAEMLTRALRTEALRLLQVFFRANLADKPWLESLFETPEVAAFLGPAANQLPVRPFRD